MVGVRVVEAEEREVLGEGETLDAQIVLRRHLVAARPLLAAGVLDSLDAHDVRGLPLPPEERAAALLRVRLAAVLADLIHDRDRNLDHAFPQNSSERYRVPPSGRTVTTVAGAPPS